MKLRLRWLTRVLDIFSFSFVVLSLAFLVRESVEILHGAGNSFPASGSAFAFIALATLLYLLGHVLRAIRLYLIMGVGRLPFTALLGFHSAVAFGTLASPYKLGEPVRAVEAYRLLSNDMLGVFSVWLDRLFDVAIILLALIFLLLRSGDHASTLIIFYAAGFFLFFSIGVVLVLPGAIASLERVMLASSSRRTMIILRVCVFIRNVFSALPHLDGAMISLLAVITVGIWSLEIATILLIMTSLPETGGSLIANSLEVFANLLAFAPDVTIVPLALYRVVSMIGLALLCSVTLRRYLRTRAKAGLSQPVTSTYVCNELFSTPRLRVKGRTR